jgi:hypothetical protein
MGEEERKKFGIIKIEDVAKETVKKEVSDSIKKIS